METRSFGETGLRVSVLGFGGSEIGYDGVSPAVVDRLLASALDAGLNVIDTAECYEESEELIGRALAGRRNECLLFTKCGHASGLDSPDWDLRTLERTIERSLRRLRTDRLDLIQLHSCSERTLREGRVIEVLERARQAGKTRFIGYSGDRAGALEAVRSGRFDALQTSVSLADQEAIDLTLPEARAAGMGIIAKRPLANVAWAASAPGDDHEPSYWDRSGYNDAYERRFRRLAYSVLEGPLREAVGIALRFTVSVPGVHTAIVGTTKPGRWQQNAALLEAGPLEPAVFGEIRNRWREVARPTWHGKS